MSVSFDTAPDWLQLTPDDFSGEILSGETALYNLTANSDDITNGTYTAYIVINTNATVGSTFIPVDPPINKPSCFSRSKMTSNASSSVTC